MSPTSGVEQLVTDVIAEAKKLREDVAAYEEAHRRERRAYRVMAAFMLASIAVGLFVIASVRSGLDSTEETVGLIRSCTTPQGECYKQSQARTGDFRTRLLGSVAIITDCDVSTDDLEKFRRCVQNRTALDSSETSEPVESAAPVGR